MRVLTVLLILASLACGRRDSTPTADGPIVLISIDTLRADRLPIYGYDRIAAPAIDALAREGLVFDRAYAHSPQTLPSHASILTAALPFEHGVRDNIRFVLGTTLPHSPSDSRLLGTAPARSSRRTCSVARWD